MLDDFCKGLAYAFLAGPWTANALVARGQSALAEERPPPWLRKVVARLVASPTPLAGREARLIALLRADEDVRLAHLQRGARLRHWFVPEPAMVPVDGSPAAFPVLPIASHDVLAAHLDVSIDELAWFADLRRMNASRAPSARAARALTHYHYNWVAKARGGYRLLEAPKPRLKRMQRWILRSVLAPIPISDLAHGFAPGRGVRTFVAPHVGRAVVVRLDLQDFFASVGRTRIVATFCRIGYPRSIAETLAGLCTAPTPDWVLAAQPRDQANLGARFLTNARLRDAHLPQGAPTSPALSNLAAWRLDRRLAALAAGFGATMTRYADDLAFAGDAGFERSLRFFLPRVSEIVLDEGFRVNQGKTRVMRQGARQQLCGVIVNDRANLPRRERDRLRAILHNAARFGPASQNRDGHPDFRRHLEGRVAWAAALNPDFGRRAKQLLAQVRWDDAGHPPTDA